MKNLIFLVSIIINVSTALANQCSDYFKDDIFTNVSGIVLDKKSKRLFQQTLIEETIRRHMKDEKLKLSEKELDIIRTEARKFDAELDRIYKRLYNFYKLMNGSERNRIQVDIETEVMKKSNKLLLGSVEEVYEGLSRDFSQYEKNYLLALDIRKQIYALNFNNPVPKETLKTKLKELEELDKYLGENIYLHIELKETLEKLQKVTDGEASRLASELLFRLKKDSEAVARKNILKYRDITIAEIKDYLKLSSKAEISSLKAAAVHEFVTLLKMFAVNGPIFKAVKWLVYKIPEKVSIFRFQDIPLRKLVASSLGFGEIVMLKNIYMGDMNSILEQRGLPHRQYELLISANSKSLEKDEFLVVFARVPENKNDWLEIKEYASKVAVENKFNKEFYDRILEAELKAIKERELPLYENEAGATVMGRLVITGGLGYYFINKYYLENPDAALSNIETVQSLLRFFSF